MHFFIMIVREVMLHKPGEEIKAVRIPRKWSFTSIPDETKMRNQHNELVDVLKAENVKINYLRKPTKAYPNLYFDEGSCCRYQQKSTHL